MRVLLEAHHPAHIHFWKYPVRTLIKQGHDVLLIGRDRDVMRRLLEAYDWIPHEIPKRKNRGNRFPIFEMLERQLAVASAIRRFKPDVVASLMGSYTQSAKLLGVRNIIFTDSEFQHFNHRIAHPFADEIHTPKCFYKELGKKQVRYNGIHEISFLGKKLDRSELPSFERYPDLESQSYIVVRMSAWNTLHDIGRSGFGPHMQEFINTIPKKYRILISAEEAKLPAALKCYAMPIFPEDFHDVLSQAALVLTEGASTASEAACLGVPTVYINNTEQRGYLQMLEKDYGLIHGFSDAEVGIAYAKDLLTRLDAIEMERCRISAMEHMNESIDVVHYIVETLLADN